MNFAKKIFRNKSFFKRTLIIFLSILITAVLTTSVVITLSMRVPLERSLTETQQSVINHIGQTTDTYILNQLDFIYKQHFIPANRSDDINRFLLHSTDANSFSPMDAHRLYTFLNDINVYYPFIESIDVYSPDSKSIISSRKGISSVANDTQSVLAVFNTKQADLFISSDLFSMWVSEGENKHTLNTSEYTNMISLYYPLTDHDGITRKGLVCFNIHSSVLIDYLSGFLHSDDAEFLIFNGNSLLLSSDNTDDMNLQELYKLTKDASSGLVSTGGRSVIWTSSELTSLKYLVLTDSAHIYRELIRTTNVTVFITIIILLIAAILIYYCSVRLYHPIKRTIERISFELPKDTEDELSYIDNVIQNLSFRVADLESTIDEHSDAITNQVVYDIINGNITGADEVKSRLELSGLDFDYKIYTLLFTEINNAALDNMDYEQKEYLFYTTLEKLNSFMDKIGLCLSIRHSNYIISILALDDIQGLNKITPREINLGSNINLGICPPREDITLLGQDFLMLKTYMQYSYIYGYGYIFSSDTIEKYETNGSGLGEDIFDEITALLQANKIDEVKENFSEIIRLIRTNGYSYSYTHHILLQFISIIAKSYKSIKKSDDEAPTFNILSEFNRATDLDMLTDWLFNLLDAYNNMLTNQSNDVQYDFVNKIADYITEHITENLSLSTVAAAFGISAGYLSHIFKDSLNVNFSSYINEKKFEAATHMLLNSTDLSVTDIAQKIGYYNMSYFIQQFKKKYGMTPLQYRKAHLK